jgi:hypothetical protein
MSQKLIADKPSPNPLFFNNGLLNIKKMLLRFWEKKHFQRGM